MNLGTVRWYSSSSPRKYFATSSDLVTCSSKKQDLIKSNFLGIQNILDNSNTDTYKGQENL